MNFLDPASLSPDDPFLSPNDPLREWMKDPAKMEHIKQQAMEDASMATGQPVPARSLGYADPDGNTINLDTGITEAAPIQNNKGLSQPKEPFRMTPDPDIPAQPPAETKVAANPTNSFDPEATTPMPKERPAEAGPGATEGDTDVSAQSKGMSTGDRITKALSGLKGMAPPAPNPVGTPGVRAPNNIATSPIHQLLAVLGQQASPDPIATLGRLLVAGKA